MDASRRCVRRRSHRLLFNGKKLMLGSSVCGGSKRGGSGKNIRRKQNARFELFQLKPASQLI